MIELALLMLAMQPEPTQADAATPPEQLTTVTLEYPYIIDPYVGDYYDCLKAGSYVIGDGRNFERQHRENDIPRCDTIAVSLMEQAEARLAQSRAEGFPDNYNVNVIFENVRKMHIERGRELDGRVITNLTTDEQRRQELAGGESESGLFSPEDMECIARLKSLRESREKFAETEGVKAEVIHAKTEYTEDDQKALSAYQQRLGQYSARIAFEMLRCPAEARQQRIGMAGGSGE